LLKIKQTKTEGFKKKKGLKMHHHLAVEFALSVGASEKGKKES